MKTKGKKLKQLKKSQVKHDDAKMTVEQKCLEEAKETFQSEWEINQDNIQTYKKEQEERIETLKKSYERLGEIEKEWFKFNNHIRKDEESQRFMLCNRLPDPSILPQMNTYKYVWTELENDSSIEYCLKKTQESMQLLETLDEFINDPWFRSQQNLINNWKAMRNELRNLLQSQIDKTTYGLFRKIEINMEPMNVTTSQYYCECKYFKMHLWAELITPIFSTKNTDVRHPLEVLFRPLNLVVLIPVILLDVHKVIRVLLMDYDHLSDNCRSFITPPAPIYHSKDLLELWSEELKIRSEIIQYRENLKLTMNKKIANLPADSVLSQEALALCCKPQRVLSEEIAFREAQEEELWQNEVRMKLDVFEVNLRERQFLGGIILLQILHQPPQPKYLRYKHNVTLLMKPSVLSPVDYIVSYPPISFMPENTENEMEENTDTDRQKLKEEYKQAVETEKKKLITVELTLPQSVYWFEAPQVASWNEMKGYWSSEYVHHLELDDERKTITMKIGKLGFFGLHVSRFCNLPYADWCLEGEGEEVKFYLKTPKIAAYFKIRYDKVCVEKIDNVSNEPIQHILQTFHSPWKLVQLLKSFGIDIFPEIDAGCYVSDLTPKHAVCERYIYQIWGIFSSSFCFKYSKFNRERDRRTLIFQAKEISNSYQTKFCLIKTSPTETYILDVTEESEAYSPKKAPDSKVQADLYNLFMKNCTNKAKRKADTTSFILIQTVRDFLGYIRPLSFS